MRSRTNCAPEIVPIEMIYVDLIIMDLDGTLVDSREDIADAVNFTLRKLGLKEKTLEAISSYIGGGIEDLIRKSLGKSKEKLLEKAISIFNAYYKKHYADKTRLYPNVKEALEHFRNKRKVIITNRGYELAVLTLKALGIRKYFEDIIGGDDIECRKPDSCPLDKALLKLNINDKKNSIMVGDMDLDVLAGKKAGITTCAVTYGIGKKKEIEKSNPSYIIDDILKLKDIIK